MVISKAFEKEPEFHWMFPSFYCIDGCATSSKSSKQQWAKEDQTENDKGKQQRPSNDEDGQKAIKDQHNRKRRLYSCTERRKEKTQHKKGQQRHTNLQARQSNGQNMMMTGRGQKQANDGIGRNC